MADLETVALCNANAHHMFVGNDFGASFFVNVAKDIVGMLLPIWHISNTDEMKSADIILDLTRAMCS